jgi:hypothetical protein
MMGIVLYHRTTRTAADKILQKSFRDAAGYWGTETKHRGVWLSNRPFDANEGANGETLLRVELDATETDLADFERVEDGKPFREWLILADHIIKLGGLSCCRFRRHRVRCFNGTGGGSWRGEDLRGSSSLRLCG